MPPRTPPRFAQIVLALAGLNYSLTGLALLLAPLWFYENIGHFPPFNRHYAGDLGTFLLPLGLGLLIAARDPTKHRLFIGVAAGASVLHALNHLYDTLLEPSASHLLPETIVLFLFAGALLLTLRVKP
ncbi:MAG: hypothetical protein H0T73_22980 [Ardenticatenales bacterium]|nr:hypothetical protein [Ardenticatenales bacterium]